MLSATPERNLDPTLATESRPRSLAPRLSFILPARNEERYVGMAIESIRRYCPSDLLAEIILVDHGSTDRTREIAAAAGAIVVQPTVATIAALRNAGAKLATGTVFVFLDADVTLTEDWAAEAHKAFDRILEEPSSISGSNCDAPQSNNWFLRYWFGEMAREQNANSLGSAHMIVPRSLFEQLGGFDERLRTGEDPDLCERAKALAAPVTVRPALRVIHHGYPLSIRAFVRRERWHGGGDTVSLERALRSKVVWMTLAYIGLHLAVIVGLILSWRLAVAGTVLLLGELLLSVRVRFRRMRGTPMLKAMAIFYLYYFGRSLSFISNRERGAR